MNIFSWSRKSSGNKHPRDEATTLSRLWFWYMVPLFLKGAKKDLREDDLYDVPKNYEADFLVKTMSNIWKKCQKEKYALWNLLWKCHGPYYLTICLARFFVKTVLIFFEPFAYSKIIAFFVPGHTEISYLYIHILSVALVLSKLFNSLFERNTELWLANLGVKLKAGLYALIYQKLLKIDYLKHPEMGRIITLLTKDIQILSRFLGHGAVLLECVITTMMMCVILSLRLGFSSLPVILALILTLPIHGFVIYKIKQFEKVMCENAEMRYKILKESFQYIRIIKMYIWERFFEKRICHYRRKEIVAMYKIILLEYMIILSTIALLSTTLYITLWILLNIGEKVTAEILFYLLNCYRILYDSFGIRMILSYTELGKLLACMKRIEHTLFASEIESRYQELCTSATIEARNLKIYSSTKTILHDINFKIDHPTKVILRGKPSCGKTVLLKSLIGEYYTDGILSLKGQISYASQEPWLFPGTIRQNILFGEDFDEKRYHTVLKVCTLVYDLKMMQDGDLTMIEDGGLNLSKGQCARINLARAVYREADIYLIDDCFSSLNFEVCSEIFTECFNTFLKEKIVFVVFQEDLDLMNCDQVYILENSKLTISKGSKLQDVTIFEPYISQLGIEEENEATEHTNLLAPNTKNDDTFKEIIKKGGVEKRVYLKYFLHGGTYTQYCILLLLVCCSQSLSSFYDILLPKWADFRDQFINKVSRNDTLLEEYESQANEKLLICIIVMVVSTAIEFVRYAWICFFGRKAAINLHKNSLNVLYFPITFFEDRRIGNILNKFSKDFAIIDERLFEAWLAAFKSFPMVSAVFITITYTKPSLLIFCIICLICFLAVQLVYLRSSRNLRRLDSLTRAPVIGYIKSTFEGITTIRASHNQQKLTDQFHKFQNVFISTTYTLGCTFGAFWFALDVLCVCFTAAVLIKFFLFDDGTSTAGEIGFVLLQTTFLQRFLSISLHFTAEIENLMTSVERVLEYTETRNEGNLGIEMGCHWPKTGNIVFTNVVLKYPTSKTVILNNFNLSIEGGQKVLIVGRTGTGKSSIFSILFRLYDFEGVITIDGVDIKTLSLNCLRSKLSIVSQDTVVFSGTVRDNLDSGRQCSDEELWGIIKRLKLTDVVGSLDCRIDENDDQFSCGQKQLLSLGRAMARKSNILLLDEPFSNLDTENIELVEDILVRHFMDYTVIMITHVMPSNWKYDKIVKSQVQSDFETDIRKEFSGIKWISSSAKLP